MTILLLLLFAWVAIGLLIFAVGTHTPAPGRRPLTRRASHRVATDGEPVEITLACSAAAVPPPAHTPEPWDIVLVIDHSGSMGAGPGSVLDEARTAAIRMVRTTPEAFRFSVVEFDHGSRQLCPLTSGRRGIVRAIRGIAGGGGTDIALGLGTAGGVLEGSEEGSGRRRAILLLSDGGSAPEPALEAAARIKAAEVTVITVGVGGADMPLLREIASSPDHAYEAGDISQVAELYTRIGQTMAGSPLSGAEVTEGVRRPLWGLRGWGEIRPTAASPADGRISWLLAALERQPTEVSYTAAALCPGWHRVAAEPGRLHGRLYDGRGYSAKSNRGPWVLVLPPLPGRSVLWLFLNPLFFLLFGRFFCRPQALCPPVPRKPVRPRAVPLPPPLPVPAELNAPEAAVPALVVGLGEAGTHALTHCKRLMWERGRPELYARVRLLALDTAGPGLFPAPGVGGISLDPGERLWLSRSLEPVVEAEAISTTERHRWLPAAELLAGGARPDLHRGTGNQRALGRLALLENLESVASAIDGELDHLSREGSGLQVLVTGSTGGGTASGALADLCWLLRTRLAARGFGDAGITLFLLPPVGRGDGPDGAEESEQRLCNHEALVRELDRLATLRGTPLSPTEGAEPAARWFDRVMVVGSSRREPGDPSLTLYPKAGEMLHWWLTCSSAREFFMAQDPQVYRLTEHYRRVVGHRIDPASFYLYPRSVFEWLARETLLQLLAQHWWATGAEAQAVSLDAPAEAGADPVVDALIREPAWEAGRPWLLRNLDRLKEVNALSRLLLAGGGPRLTAESAGADETRILSEQRALLVALLDAAISDALNGRLERSGAPVRIGLPGVHRAMRRLDALLLDAAENANVVAGAARSDPGFAEASLVGELIAQARREVRAWLTHLESWAHLLGEGGSDGRGGQFKGLMAQLRARAARARQAVEAARNYASPSLPLDDAALGRIQERYFQSDAEALFGRLVWAVERGGPGGAVSLPGVVLTVHDAQPLLFRTGADMEETVHALLTACTGVLGELGRVWQEVALADLSGAPDLKPTLSPPRAELPFDAAQALVLVQGADCPRRNVEQVVLPVSDARETRLVACERNVPLHALFDYGECGRPLPFVQQAEYHAHRFLRAYCALRDRVPLPIPPDLVALFEKPECLRGFLVHGLLAGAVAREYRGGREIWLANHDGDEWELSEIKDDPDRELLMAARHWIANCMRLHARAGAAVFSGPLTESEERVAARLMTHPLLAGAGHETRAAFGEIALALLTARTR